MYRMTEGCTYVACTLRVLLFALLQNHTGRMDGGHCEFVACLHTLLLRKSVLVGILQQALPEILSIHH